MNEWWIRLLGSIFLGTAMTAAVLGALIHFLTTPWWRTIYGRHLALYLGSIAALFSLWFVGRVVGWGQEAWYQTTLTVVFGLWTLALVRQLVLQVQAWMERRRH